MGRGRVPIFRVSFFLRSLVRSSPSRGTPARWRIEQARTALGPTPAWAFVRLTSGRQAGVLASPLWRSVPGAFAVAESRGTPTSWIRHGGAWCLLKSAAQRYSTAERGGVKAAFLSWRVSSPLRWPPVTASRLVRRGHPPAPHLNGHPSRAACEPLGGSPRRLISADRTRFLKVKAVKRAGFSPAEKELVGLRRRFLRGSSGRRHLIPQIQRVTRHCATVSSGPAPLHSVSAFLPSDVKVSGLHITSLWLHARPVACFFLLFLLSLASFLNSTQRLCTLGSHLRLPPVVFALPRLRSVFRARSAGVRHVPSRPPTRSNIHEEVHEEEGAC